MISLLTSTAIAQNFETGTYLVSGGSILKMELLKRENNTIKASLLTTAGEKVLVFYPIPNASDTYECETAPLILTKQQQVLVLLELDAKGAILSKNVVGLSRKDLKNGKKTLGIKTDLLSEFRPSSKSDLEGEVPEFFVKNPSSEFHKQQVGKLVFFSEKPTIGQEDLSKVKTHFKVGDDIWAAAYLPVPLKTKGYMYDLTNAFYDAYGSTSYWACIGMDKNDPQMLPKENEIFNQCTVKDLTEQDLEQNYVVFQVLPKELPNHTMNADGAIFLMERFGERLEAKEYKIRVALTNGRMETSEEFFSGYFHFDAREGTEMYAQMSQDLANKKLEDKPLPTAVRVDADLEAEMLQQIRLWARNNNWSDVDFKRVIITLDWQVIKDDLGNIEGKYIEGNALYSCDEGCGHRNFGFIRRYLGSSKYDPNLMQYTVGEVAALSCDKVKEA